MPRYKFVAVVEVHIENVSLFFCRTLHNGVYFEDKAKDNDDWRKRDAAEAVEAFGVEDVRVGRFSAAHKRKACRYDGKPNKHELVVLQPKGNACAGFIGFCACRSFCRSWPGWLF